MNGEIEEVQHALNGWLDTKSIMWNQRSRNMWLVDGDQNTSFFFHAKASHWQQHNSILGLYNAEGVWQEDDQRVEGIVVDYFTNIFESNGLSDVSLVVNVIKPVVTDVMNTSLTQDFQATEVIKALKQMHPKKAQGPDGMPPIFY